MSFASEAKAELCRMNRRKKCCAVAEAYGVVLYCNSFTPREIRIITGSEEFASLLPKLFKRAFGVSFDSLPEAGGKPGGRKTLLMTDRDKIASVIYNRLERPGETGGLLQIDAALVYAAGRAITQEDYTTLDSPYNLYQHTGLPPTAISNPGMSSITAALQPAETDYYYYVLGADGKHVFSETLSEHQQNVAAASAASGD